VKSLKPVDRCLKKILESVEEGRIESSLATKGNRKGFSFTIERTEALAEADKYDGYQVFMTTELNFSEVDSEEFI